MSHFTTERALWEITSGPGPMQAYMADPGGFLGRFGLSEAERTMILDKDVVGLIKMGNSDMLVMMFWIAVSGGFAALGEYLGRLNAPA